ncbi:MULTISPECIES: response regulator [Pseudomonas]|uniref:Response regulator n=1 Tax=Pseudomonas wuhanensis TaxID=2954098 RepID=A0ABY9GWT0_9PSED|nr:MULTISPECIES: response regulator [unclassified Pseudomonas]WLI14364.1 response regulator [Pseudomonas sp. FP603]WLI20280.1 response regulator [Pseudomonas sp. FP607]
MNVNWKGMLPIEGTVIIVEDDPTLRSLMTDILSEVGANTLAFVTADDALTHLLENHGQCPLVIVDQSLPGQVQGAEFIVMLQGKWPLIASILTSGYLLDPTQVPASTIYLQKPFSLDDLVIAVATLLQPGHPIHQISSQRTDS